MKPRNEPLIGAYEPEGKYAVDDLDQIRSRIQTLTGTIDPPMQGIWKAKQTLINEDNRIYDFFGLFKKAGWTVRIRKDLHDRYELTVKGRDVGERVKNCPEYIDREVPRCVAGLIRLLMRETDASYKKVREKYKGEDGIEICLDRPYIDDHGVEQALGTYVEIEAKGKKDKGEMMIEDWKYLLGIEGESIRTSYAQMARKKRMNE